MTTHIPNKASHKLTVVGCALSTQTFVHVRWYWSILPVGLVFLTAVFLAWTILISIRNSVPIWKSSSLAVIVHGLSDHISDHITAEKLNAMESNAEDYAMGIAVVRQRWRLKGTLAIASGRLSDVSLLQYDGAVSISA